MYVFDEMDFLQPIIRDVLMLFGTDMYYYYCMTGVGIIGRV